MEDNKSFNAGVWTFFVTFVAAILTYIQFDPKLTSSRPTVRADAVSSAISEQRVPSRLWQDPFGESSKIPGKDITPWADVGKSYARMNDHCSVMAVMVEGFPYPEDVEVRLRLRYAVQTALASQNFKPRDRSHIGLASLNWPTGDQLLNSTNDALAGLMSVFSVLFRFPSPVLIGYMNSLPHKSEKEGQLLVPFEWFEKDDSSTNKSAILLLWLKEEEFADFPLSRCGYLFGHWSFAATDPPPIKLIGPRSSDTLGSMVADTNVYRFRAPLKNMMIYSPEATAPDALITPVCSKSNCANSNRLEIANSIRTNLDVACAFTNLVVSDDELSRQLFLELASRGVDARYNGGDSVVLISETDTSYGRSLPLSFVGASFKTNSPPACSLSQFLRDSTNWPSNILRYAYLRGLDGTPAKMDSKPRETPKKTDSTDNPRAIRTLDEYGRSEGESQFDYARRLARELELKNWELKNQGREIKAIGILGSDIYDKLILLQALRSSFDHALFFTTDMDARYLDPEQNPITRNLIVASSYGLAPDCKLNPPIPRVTSFRDCYQTAVFTACLNALGQPSAEKGLIKMFEVGRTRAVELGYEGHPVHDDLLQGFTLGRRRYLSLAMILIGGIGILALLRSVSGLWADNYRSGLLRLYYLVGSLLPSGTPSAGAAPLGGIMNVDGANVDEAAITKRKRLWILVILAFGAAFMAWIIHEAWIQRDYPDAEPIRFNEGVSIWPTELLRCLAAVLSFLFVVKSWFLFEEHRLKLRELFFNSSPSSKSDDAARKSNGIISRWIARTKSLCNWLETTTFVDLKSWRVGRSINFWSEPHGKVDAQKLYEAYLLRGRFVSRMCRIIPTFVCYLLLSFGIFELFGIPPIPYRGHVSFNVDWWALTTSVIGYGFLAFYVVDATRLTERFIHRLGDGETIWPHELLKVYSTDRHMDPDHLSGYLDVQFVAFHTTVVGRLFKYPFIVLSLLWVARNRFFDNWTWPPPMSIIFGMNAIIVFLCAFLIRRAAAEVRKAAIADLRKIELHTIADTQQPHSWHVVDETGLNKRAATAYAEKIRHLISEIEGVKMGSYTSWIKDSAVQALFIPGVGYGLITLFEKLFF